MKLYRQLCLEEREDIALLHAQGLGPTAIGRELGRDKSTISREIKRNQRADGRYIGGSAQRKSLVRCARPCILERNEKLRIFVLERLQEGWSPECITGWLRCGNEPLHAICHEAIYRYIYAPANKAARLWKYLFRSKSQRKAPRARRSHDKIKHRISIHQRPQAIDSRTEFGHWEADYMIFKRRQPLLVLHERKSKFTMAVKLASRSAAETVCAITTLLKRFSKNLLGSITFDNDTGFALHHHLHSALDIKTYFCDAYASWQKGGVENANGRLRYFLPKRMDLATINENDIEDIIMSYNLTPRRCLGWKTPLQAIAKSENREITLQFTDVALRG